MGKSQLCICEEWTDSNLQHGDELREIFHLFDQWRCWSKAGHFPLLCRCCRDLAGRCAGALGGKGKFPAKTLRRSLKRRRHVCRPGPHRRYTADAAQTDQACLTRTPRTTKGTSLCVPQLQCSMSTHKKFTTQSRKLPGRLLQYSANKASREWTKEKEEAARTAKEQEVADRRKAAAAKAALTKERKAAEAAAEAEAAKEAAELRQQLKAARKERRVPGEKKGRLRKGRW